MKLYTHDALRDGQRFRAFTRDRAAKALKKGPAVSSAGVVIRPQDWTFRGEIRTSDTPIENISELAAGAKAKGFAVCRLPPIPQKLYAFNLTLDIGDFRIYSTDPDLSEFRKFRHRLELSLHGNKYKGGAEIRTGETPIQSESEIKALGVDDVDGLLFRGFHIALVTPASLVTTWERQLLRELKKEMAEFGIEVTNVAITNISVAEASPVSVDQQSGGISNVTAPSTTPDPTQVAPLDEPRRAEAVARAQDTLRQHPHDYTWLAIGAICALALGISTWLVAQPLDRFQNYLSYAIALPVTVVAFIAIQYLNPRTHLTRRIGLLCTLVVLGGLGNGINLEYKPDSQKPWYQWIELQYGFIGWVGITLCIVGIGALLLHLRPKNNPH